MKRSTYCWSGTWLVVAGLVWLTATWRADLPPAWAADAAGAEVAPVETDMHEFMEYLFQPTYRRLKATMAEAPADNAGWKAIKSDALILAEGGNLLLAHQPSDEAADWVRHSVDVRAAGALLYQAGKAKDYATARRHYEAMLLRCNACHDQFAGGEHQLAP